MRRFAPVLVLLVFAVLAVLRLKWVPELFATKGLTTAKERAEEIIMPV